MRKETKQLEGYWNEWLKTADKLLSHLHEQTAALSLRQVERLDDLQPKLDQLMDEMEQVDEKAATVAKKLAEDLGVEPNLRSLVTVLEKTEAQQVQLVANKVIVTGRNVQKVMNKNKALIENELEYVNGTLSLVAMEAQDAGNYPRKRSQANVLMNQAA